MPSGLSSLHGLADAAAMRAALMRPPGCPRARRPDLDDDALAELAGAREADEMEESEEESEEESVGRGQTL